MTGSGTGRLTAERFSSSRIGMETLDIFKQDITQTDAEPIVATSEQEWHPSLSPDGAFILYLVSAKPGAACNTVDANSSWRRTSRTWC